MNLSDLTRFREWFGDYCRTFCFKDETDQKNILLKELHSKNVSKNMGMIAEALAVDPEKVLLAETIGLFHDIGRFSQYAKYRTFRDSVSVNHGRLGAEVLSHEGILAGIPLHEQEIILSAVKFHNAFSIPEKLDDESAFSLKMVRDSDKLDIWRIFAGFCELPKNERGITAGLELPDLPEYSEKMLDSIKRKKQSAFSDLKSLNDFILMQLSWIYDLNFPVSFRKAFADEHLMKIAATLPQTEEIIETISTLKAYISDRSKD